MSGLIWITGLKEDLLFENMRKKKKKVGGYLSYLQVPSKAR